MQVKDEDISTLIELQHNDMELLRVQKAIADLPQRKTIVAARKKIKTIEEKQETVGKLRAKAEEKLAGISEEDGKLAAKQEEAQKAVDSASGYRDVEAHTREMDGYAKRRATLSWIRFLQLRSRFPRHLPSFGKRSRLQRPSSSRRVAS